MMALWRFILFHWPQLICVLGIAVIFLLFDNKAYTKASDRTGLPVRFWKGFIVAAVLLIGVGSVCMGTMKLLGERTRYECALQVKDGEISLLKKEIVYYKARKP